MQRAGIFVEHKAGNIAERSGRVRILRIFFCCEAVATGLFSGRAAVITCLRFDRQVDGPFRDHSDPAQSLVPEFRDDILAGFCVNPRIAGNIYFNNTHGVASFGFCPVFLCFGSDSCRHTLPLSYRSAEGGSGRGVSGPPDKLPVIAWFLESFTVATLTGVKVAPAVWTNTVITHSLFTPFRCRIGLNRSRSPLAR